MPNLRQLEYLVALSDTRHFRRAAERTNTTQPTLSEQVKALEERLGVQLVERSSARVLITPVGEQVVDIARRMLRDANEIRAISASGAKDLAGLLKLGLPPTVGPYLLQRVAPALHKSHPDLKLYLREELPVVLPRALEEGVHDVIVTSLPIRGKDIETVTLFREPLYLTVGNDHRLARRKSVVLADIAGEDILALGHGHQLHDAVVALCKQIGARVRLEFEGTSLDMLREMVVMGLGITLMPGLYTNCELLRDENVRTFEIADRRLFRTIGMAWRKSSPKREQLLKLAEFFKHHAGST